MAADDEGVERTILFNLSGHGHFDMAAYDDYLAGRLEDFALPEDEIQRAQRRSSRCRSRPRPLRASGGRGALRSRARAGPRAASVFTVDDVAIPAPDPLPPHEAALDEVANDRWAARSVIPTDAAIVFMRTSASRAMHSSTWVWSATNRQAWPMLRFTQTTYMSYLFGRPLRSQGTRRGNSPKREDGAGTGRGTARPSGARCSERSTSAFEKSAGTATGR